MAVAPKRQTIAKPGSGKLADKTAAQGLMAAPLNGDLPMADLPASEFPQTQLQNRELKQADPGQPIETSRRIVPAALDRQAKRVGPGAALVDAQVRTLADLCEAMDLKCLDLLGDLAAARNAQTTAERQLADFRQTSEQELLDIRETHEKELAEAHRTQAMHERELASLRLVLERANRPGIGRGDRLNRHRPNGEAQAARLLPMLETTLAAGAIKTLHDTHGALAQFGAAGMVDAVEGTREAPVCHGWLLSRSDLEAEPLMFLMDDSGLLGWTEANRDRPDVNAAFQNTKPRPGFRAQLSRVPVGRLRGIVAVVELGDGAAAFFEASCQVIPEDLFSDKEK